MLYFLLSLFVLSLAQARSTCDDHHPKCDGECASATRTDAPTRPFTVQAFQSPFPSGQGITGLSLTAQGGRFYLTEDTTHTCPADKPCGLSSQTVFSVDGLGRCYLVSATNVLLYTRTKPTHRPQDVAIPCGQDVFIDPSDGHLGFSIPNGPPTPPGAILVNFLHLGKGTTAFTQGNGFVTEAPGVFQWIGSENSYWVACPTASQGYQVSKIVSASQDFSKCVTGVSLAAIDYSGANSAAYEYV